MFDGIETAATRHFRRQATTAESRLWQALRHQALAGAKFRRHHPVGPYVADFVCLEAKLIVELDGGQDALETESDNGLNDQLETLGFHVLRFRNNAVLSNQESVLTMIEEALRASHNAPLPGAGTEAGV